MKPEVNGRRVDRCSCGRRVHRDDLRRALQDVVYSGQNRFIHSSYHTDLWACDAEDEGEVSVGIGHHVVTSSPSWSYSTTTVGGNTIPSVDTLTVNETGLTQTWSGTGTYRSSAGVDASSWTTLCAAWEIGFYHLESSPEASVTMGLCLSDGTGTVLERTWPWTIKTADRIWFPKTISELDGSLSSSELFFYVTVTADSGVKWWIDRAWLGADVIVPGHFVRTTGTASNYSAPTRVQQMLTVCKDCYKPLWKDVNPDKVTEDAVEPVLVDTDTRVI